MKLLKNYLTILALCLCFFSCTEDNTVEITSKSTLEVPVETSLDPSEAYTANNVPYGDHPKQKIDIYLPPNRDKNTKIILLVHGGTWSAGKKEDMNAFSYLIKNQLKNYGIVNIGYRLATPETPAYPMQINDITAVINLLKKKRDYYIISDKFGFSGISAGAHLSMLWAYAFDKGNNIEVVNNIVGPTNFTDPVYLQSNNPQLLDVLKNLYGKDDVSIPFLKTISPYHQVKAGAPPTLMLYGAKDTIVPVSQSKFLKNRLDSLNIKNDYKLYPDQGHIFMDIKTINDSWSKMKNFIETHMGS